MTKLKLSVGGVVVAQKPPKLLARVRFPNDVPILNILWKHFMAKLLTKIWKTIQGKFFETEEEALEAERKAFFLKIWTGLTAPYDKEYHDEVAKYMNTSYDRRGTYPRHKTELPYGFIDQFYEKLKEDNLLAPIVFSSENDENNS